MRINIVTGHFGSGKTEFALNYALKLRQTHDNVVICDMDIVNPYFRTNDVREFLKKHGIRVISSEYASTNIDMPTLPGDILSVFADKDCQAVLDVGGDEDGAVALGRFQSLIRQEPYNLFLVVNALRPLTQTPEEVVQMAREIEAASRLCVTALVNNTNLSVQTEPKHLLDGMPVVNAAANMLGKEVAYLSGRPDILDALPPGLLAKRFDLNLYMQLPF